MDIENVFTEILPSRCRHQCTNIFSFVNMNATHWIPDKYSNSTSTKELFKLLEVLEAYVETKWKSEDLICYKLLEEIKMFRIILATLIVWVASGEGKYMNQNLTIYGTCEICQVQRHFFSKILSLFWMITVSVMHFIWIGISIVLKRMKNHLFKKRACIMKDNRNLE